MASTFSTNLAIELIGTGDQAGTWGTTTNSNLGTLIEQAISGYVTQAVATGTDTTITIPNGSTGVARNMYIELTGTGGTNTNLIVPANKKLYFIFNNSTGAVTVKVSGQTGVSVPTGKKMVLVSNGTDIVNGLNYIADFGTNSFSVTNLTASSATITNLIATSGSITNLVSSDASATVLRAGSATLTHLSATSASITNLALTSLTISSLSITNVSVASATVSSNLTLSGGTANGVLYLNGSKVATSGTALVFDGTNLGIGGSPSFYQGSGLLISRSGYATIRLNDSSGGGTAAEIKQSDSAGLILESISNRPIQFNVNASEQMRLTSTGLGIGTSSPVSRLDVQSSVGSIPGFGNATSRLLSTATAGVGVGSSIVFGGKTNNSTADYTFAGLQGIKESATAGNYAGSLLFLTQNSGGSALLTEGMRLDSAGRFGIGTEANALTNALTVYRIGSTQAAMAAGNSNTGLNGTLFGVDTAGNGIINQTQAFATIFSTSNTERMRLDSSGNLGIGTTTIGSRVTIGDPGTGLAFSNAASGNFNIGLLAGTGSALAYVFQRANSDLLFGTNNTERARIDSSGNLGIGTTSFGASSVKVIGIGNATTVPTGNPTGGGVLYVEAGALKYRGSSGTVTTIANA